jgi:hypothetical protein
MRDNRTIAPELQIQMKYYTQVRISRLLIIAVCVLLTSNLITCIEWQFEVDSLKQRVEVLQNTRSNK